MIDKVLIIKKINKLPSELIDVIYISRNLAKIENVGVYLVGGFVRDLLLDVENFDLDIVVEKDGINFAYKLSRILDGQLVKHRAFGTATLTMKNGLKIDIATCRKEKYPAPAALPIVESGSIRDDLSRRDFTINAMACHIDYKNFGQVIDFFGGLDDLENKRISFLHIKSFIDDPTRIIRAVRFEERFRFHIEDSTMNFIRQAKKMKMLEKVQKHRIRDELVIVFKEKDPYSILKRLKQLYNLTFIDKHIKLDKKLNSTFSLINKTRAWFKDSFSQRRDLDVWLMYLIAFIYCLDMNSLLSFLRKYAFRRGETKRILSFKKQFKKINAQLSDKFIFPIKLHNILDPLAYEVILLIFVMSKDKKTKQRIKEFLFEHHHKKLSITGSDLLSLGVRPGPGFKKIFKAVFHAKINGKVSTKKEEIELAKKIINKK